MTRNRSTTLRPTALLLACLLPIGVAVAQEDPATPPTVTIDGPVSDTPQPETTETQPQVDDADADVGSDAEPATPGEALVIRDLVVLHSDHFSETINDPQLVESTLFAGVPHSGRSVVDRTDALMSNRPMPLGVITFEGAIAEPIRVNVQLPLEDAMMHAHWPEYAQKGATSIDWYEVREAEADMRVIGAEDGDHWLCPLRESEDRLWLAVHTGPAHERFMMYDSSFPFEPSLALGFEDERYQVTDTFAGARPSPPLALLVQRNTEDWTVAVISGDWDAPTQALDMSQGQAATHATIQGALAPLTELLTERGYNANEIALALGMVEMGGLDRSSVSLVYVMPEGMIDRYVWLRTRPEPDQLIRTAIVVVTNVDPNLGSQVDELIAQLGHETWATRERAQRELVSLGEAAVESVQDALNSDDPEIVHRARQILNAYDEIGQR